MKFLFTLLKLPIVGIRRLLRTVTDKFYLAIYGPFNCGPPLILYFGRFIEFSKEGNDVNLNLPLSMENYTDIDFFFRPTVTIRPKVGDLYSKFKPNQCNEKCSKSFKVAGNSITVVAVNFIHDNYATSNLLRNELRPGIFVIILELKSRIKKIISVVEFQVQKSDIIKLKTMSKPIKFEIFK